jgi:Uma2 family endonuclease
MQTAQETSPSVPHRPPLPETGQRVILRGISWATYEQLLDDFQDSHAAHFAYDRGVLEIMAPSFEHEKINRLINVLCEEIAAELDVDCENAGSTTFKREDLARGFEPDTCFYVHDVERIRGKKEIDLTIDPPPDLVIEIDITSSSLNKFPIYASVGVPEVWRYDGKVVTIYTLRENGQYQIHEASVAFPKLTSPVITQFVEERQSLKRTAWIRRVREWARQQRESRESSN